MNIETKRVILKILEEAYPLDVSISEVASKAGVNPLTASTHLKILEAEGKIEFTRVVGRSKMFRFKA